MNSEFDWLAPLVEAGPIPGLARPLDVVWSVPKTSGGEAAKVHLMASTDQEPTANGEPDVVEQALPHPLPEPWLLVSCHPTPPG